MEKNGEMAKLEKWEKTAKTYEIWDKLIIYLKRNIAFLYNNVKKSQISDNIIK